MKEICCPPSLPKKWQIRFRWFAADEFCHSESEQAPCGSWNLYIIHFFAVSVPAVWNNIPAAVCDSVSLFLRHIFLTVLTHHATDSDPLAPPIHF